jgi:acetylornithine deacetylase/succinyl-diaminopimelate desuccinylase-like protein
MPDPVSAALDHLESHWDAHLHQLMELVRIPGVSAEPPPSAALAQSAEAVKRAFEAAGLERCEVIDFPGGHPYVYGEWLHAPGAPTVLLYGHHDVMPPGRPEKWVTPPFEPSLRDGRLYGRGAVDDKAGVMVHVAAIASYLRTTGRLPLNVKFIVEGEEEAGSHSLDAFLARYAEKLAADVILLTDTANHEAGLPSLTTSLRGLVGVRVDVQALDHPVHSGMWGGPIPDPVMALCRALAELTDADGRPAAFLREGVRPLSDADRGAYARLPYDEARFRADVGLVEGAALIGNPDLPVWARVWREPSLTVIALEARPIAGSTNQIIEAAHARVSLRVVPDQDPKALQDALVRHFESRVPWGLRVTVTRESAAGWWVTETTHPAFEAAAVALRRGYGRDAVHIGCGGSIPFVAPFARHLGGVPALLVGVEDPRCNAHGENESLLVEDFKKGARASVYLYDELARAARGA